MPIKVKTRKILWSKSGNRCAICKRLLVQKSSIVQTDFIVGEECHIISSKENGPRGKTKKLTDHDVHENLILLCANDHKLIDEFPETYTWEIVNSLKANHENWIEAAIEKDLENYIKSHNNIEFLEEIVNCNQIDAIIQNCHFHFFDSTSIVDNSLSITVAELFDSLTDYSDVYSDIEFAARTRYLLNLMDTLTDLNNQGIKFFGKSITREYAFANIPISQYKIALIIAFLPETNPSAIQNGKLATKIPDDFRPGT